MSTLDEEETAAAFLLSCSDRFFMAAIDRADGGFDVWLRLDGFGTGGEALKFAAVDAYKRRLGAIMRAEEARLAVVRAAAQQEAEAKAAEAQIGEVG